MPWNFPVTQDESGQIIANAVTNALNMRYQRGQQRTMLELEHPGFHFGNMPTVQDVARTSSNAVVPSSTADTSTVVQGATDPALTPSGVALHIASPSVSVSQPNQFQSTIASALKAMPRSERNAPASTVDSGRYLPLSGGYIDTQEMMNRLLPQMMLQARGKYFESQAEASGKVAGDPSESLLRGAQTNLANRNAGTPRLGDPNYAPLMGQVAGAQEGAKAPILTNTAINIARGEAPIRTQQAINTAAGVAPIEVNKAIDIKRGELPFAIQEAEARAGITPRAIAARAALPGAESAAAILQNYDQPGIGGALWGKTTLGRYTMTKEGQIASQAAQQLARNYLDGRGLRNAPQSQVDQVANSILLQPGEEGNAQVRAQKATNRTQMLQEMRGIGMVQGAGGDVQSTPNGGLQSKYDAAYQHLKGLGKTAADIQAQIGARP